MPVVKVPMMVEMRVAMMKVFYKRNKHLIQPVKNDRVKITLRLFSSIMLA